MKPITAVYEDGVFKPQQPVELEERSQVQLVVEPAAEADVETVADWQIIDELIGIVDGGPDANVGRDHDDYIYRR